MSACNHDVETSGTMVKLGTVEATVGRQTSYKCSVCGHIAIVSDYAIHYPGEQCPAR